MNEMQSLPKIFTPELVVSRVLQDYGFSGGKDLEILAMPQGFGTALMHARHPDFDLVIKQISLNRPLERTQFSLQYHHSLYHAGIPCPRPHRTLAGDNLTTIRGLSFCVQDWCLGSRFNVEGADIHSRRNYRRKAGQLLGRVHAAANHELLHRAPRSCYMQPLEQCQRLPRVERILPWSRGGPVASRLWLLFHESGNFGREIRRALPLIAAARQKLIGSPLTADAYPDRVLPVHGDFHFENVLFNEGQVSGLIDFDNACITPRVLDLGSTLAVICAEREHEADFLAAYLDTVGEVSIDPDLLRSCVLLRLLRSLLYQITNYTRRAVRSQEKARWWIRRLIGMLEAEYN